MARQKGVDKQAWLDWLNDEPPSAAAQAEIRARRVAQANRYQERPAAQPAQPVQPPAAKNSEQPAAVSIQIQIPAFNAARWRQRWRHGIERLRRLFRHLQALAAAHKGRSIGIAVVAFILLASLLVPHWLHFGRSAVKTAQGSATASTSGGADTGYDKPPFQVVVPSTKPKLTTPDGVHSVYDGKKNTFSFSDSLKSYGFIVSQQPIPTQFKDGADAVTQVSKQLSSALTTAKSITTLFGPAAIITNSKYNSQTVVTNVRDLLVFIQSSHSFTDTDWTDYINALQ